MTTPTSKLEALLNQVGDSLFQPTHDQKRAKSTLWASIGQDPLATPSLSIDLPLALKLGRDPRISQWWALSGFQDWLLNREEFKQRMEFLAHVSLDVLEDILTTPLASATDRLNAIKVIMQVGKKIPSGTAEPSGLPKDIENMSKAQLEEFIRLGLKLVEPTTSK